MKPAHYFVPSPPQINLPVSTPFPLITYSSLVHWNAVRLFFCCGITSLDRCEKLLPFVTLDQVKAISDQIALLASRVDETTAFSGIESLKVLIDRLKNEIRELQDLRASLERKSEENPEQTPDAQRLLIFFLSTIKFNVFCYRDFSM
jgi:hypothetical protein